MGDMNDLALPKIDEEDNFDKLNDVLAQRDVAINDAEGLASSFQLQASERKSKREQMKLKQAKAAGSQGSFGYDNE